jgi:hypothetical protein
VIERKNLSAEGLAALVYNSANIPSGEKTLKAKRMFGDNRCEVVMASDFQSLR